jgi:hypothetical protein
MPGSVRVITIANKEWWLADPYDTQNCSDERVPRGPGVFLWLRRAEPLAPTATGDVLFVGETANLANRLRQFSDGFPHADATLQCVFDLVIAPRLEDRLVKDLVVGRKALAIAQMWIRDHVVFAWTPWLGSDRRARALALKREVSPLLEGYEGWNRFEGTDHEDHDITLPLVPEDHHTTLQLSPPAGSWLLGNPG